MVIIAILSERKICNNKIAQLKAGYCVYAESSELIRLIKRAIKKENLSVQLDNSNGGCWFTPNA